MTKAIEITEIVLKRNTNNKSDKSMCRKIDSPRHVRNELGFKDYESNDKFKKRLPAVETYVVTSCLIAA